MFLKDDSKCVQMGEYTDVGGVADIYVEYHGEQDSEHSSSGSDFEKDEIMQLIDDDDEPDIVISAEPTDIPDDEVDLVMVPDDSGVITQLICSPVKQVHGRRKQVEAEQVVAGSQLPVSHVFNPSQAPAAARGNCSSEATDADSVSEFDSDPEYEPHSDDSGENSEVVVLRSCKNRVKKRNAHPVKIGKNNKASEHPGASAHPATASASASAHPGARSSTPPAPQARSTAPPAPQERSSAPPPVAAQARTSTFKPPRNTSRSAQAGPSTGTDGGFTKKRKRAPASSIPSFKYFTASGNV
ncbi:hypothetical protein D1007_22750 [Hordeum vulgare]|nr:hypothetical protein D1007_22750 [Hordeum vulgare]